MKKTSSYGSFFALEIIERSLPSFGTEYLLLNTGRNAFEYLLSVKKPVKVFLPVLSCEALYAPLMRLNIPYAFYNVNHEFEPIFDFKLLNDDEYFLYINYYGLKDDYITDLVKNVSNIIIDNTQAFFSKTFSNIPTFNSLRKFFGVPDGSMLFNIPEIIKLPRDSSLMRFQYLIDRLELPSEIVYPLYRKVENELDLAPLLRISESTLRIFKTIPFDDYAEIRKANFESYSRKLNSINKLYISNTGAPYMYPLWIKDGHHVKRKLIKNKIYSATFWENVLDNPLITNVEKDMVLNIIPLPIDQRYSKQDIDFIVNVIFENI